MSQKRLFLVDGSGFIFRAFFAIRHLNNSQGRPTNATYGFITMLKKLLSDHSPSHIAVVFDTKEKTFRHELYDLYKANRPEPPEELIPQFGDIHRAVDAFALPRLAMPGYEADDLIGTLADRAVAEGFDQVVIVTSDKDLCQIVGEKVTLLDTMKDKVTDLAAVKERFGTSPEHVVDSLALTGDSSDNIPGVPGVGEKTAKKLLLEYGSLEGIYENLDQVKGKLQEKIRDNRDKATLALALVTIKRDVPVDVDLDDFAVRQPDLDALTALFGELEFHSLLADLSRPRMDVDRPAYRTVLTRQDLAAMIKALEKSGAFAFDTETTSTEPMRAKLVGMSFCCDDKVAYYLPVAHNYLGVPEQISAPDALAALAPILEDASIHKIAHNAKYDFMVLRNAGVTVQGVTFDTMLASYLLDPGRNSHSLDALCRDRLGHRCISFKEVCGKGKDAVTFDWVPLEAATQYAAEDAHMTWLLYKAMAREVEQQGMGKLLDEIEMPLVFVLADMETAGVKIDVDFFEKLRELYRLQLTEAEKAIHELAGHPFNLNSPMQVAQVLFEEQGLKPVKKTKSGSSTDVEVLQALAGQHPIPLRLLEYRQAHKLVSTYIETLPRLVHPETGRIHASFNQMVAATGRLSSSDPNLQNIPVRTQDGRRIREGFVPEPGKLLLSADYSQIELRIMAHVSGDPTMIEHFNRGEDIHLRTAAEIFGLMPGLVSKEQRFSAKAINFGILYGISAFRLGKDLSIGTKKAQQFIDTYFERYPRVKAFLDETIERALDLGYVETMFGRKRPVPQLQAGDQRTRSFGQRIAYNTPIQGSAADLIKIAMVRLQERILADALPLKMIIQVHDELVFEVPKEDIETMKAVVVGEMENAHKLAVPLLVEAEAGKNWAEIH